MTYCCWWTHWDSIFLPAHLPVETLQHQDSWEHPQCSSRWWCRGPAAARASSSDDHHHQNIGDGCRLQHLRRGYNSKEEVHVLYSPTCVVLVSVLVWVNTGQSPPNNLKQSVRYNDSHQFRNAILCTIYRIARKFCGVKCFAVFAPAGENFNSAKISIYNYYLAIYTTTPSQELRTYALWDVANDYSRSSTATAKGSRQFLAFSAGLVMILIRDNKIAKT